MLLATAVQHVRSCGLRLGAAERVGPEALVFTWLFNLPGECSSSPLETIRRVWLLPKSALRTAGLLFQPLKAFFSRPEVLTYGFNNRIWTLLSFIAQGCLSINVGSSEIQAFTASYLSTSSIIFFCFLRDLEE